MKRKGRWGISRRRRRWRCTSLSRIQVFFAGLSLRRAFSYWTGFWSFSPAYLNKEPLEIADVFFCSSVTVLMLLGARRFWRRDSIGALYYLALIAVFPITYYATHATPDYRQPIEPEVVVLVVMGVLSLKGMMTPAASARGDDGRRREPVGDVDVGHWAVAERRDRVLAVKVAGQVAERGETGCILVSR